MAIPSLRIRAALLLLMACPMPAVAQESVQAAQALYASASYDEALAVLDRLGQQSLSPSEILALNQQRALCLLALGRGHDAEAAIAAVVQSDPTYRPDASPRVRQAFRDVRTKLLPEIVQAEYAEARRLYDAKEWESARARFDRVIALAVDPDLSAKQIAGLADLKVLSEGFATLAAAAAAPPPAPEPAPAPEPPAPAAPPAPAVDYDAVYDGTEPGVSAPVTLRQELPRWQSAMPVPRSTGLLDVTIGKDGLVESATMKQRTATFYDRLVLEAVTSWKYSPARLNGQPVRFRKTIKISFQ